MWKRLQGHGRGKERQIGNPVLLETTYDEDQLRHIPNVSSVQNAGYQPNAPSNMAPQSYNSLSPQNPYDYNRASEVPTVSSVYSQPSPAYNRYNYNQRSDSPSGYPDISPPSSPEPEEQQIPGQPRRFRSMRDVSPVDENRGRVGAQAGSGIPVMRRAPGAIVDGESRSTQKFWGGKVQSGGKVKWDEYSGEPTSSTAGKAGQVNPGTYAKTGVPSSGQRPLGYHVSVAGPETDARKKATLSDRVGRFGTRPAPVDTTRKPTEPWSRATGRSEIVKPLKDQRSGKPLQYPRKSNPSSPEGPAKGVSSSLTGIVEQAPVPPDTAPVADEPESFDSHESPIKPVVPLKVGRNTPLASPTTPHNKAIQAPYSYPSPVTPTNNQPPAPAPSKQTEPTRQLHSAQTNTKVPRKSIEGTPDSKTSKEGPASRFSWTTYNSSTHQQSPPPSPPPPVPVSRVQTEPISAASSILNRRRPVPQPDSLPARKPVPSTISTSTSTATIIMSPDPPSPRPDSTFSTSTHKALPRPPTELTAADHIEILESQMEDLRVRRSNVYRLLKDLYNAAPPNPMVTDFRRMRLVEQRKKDFEDELAEIKREEHDVGLKLHRAWRKRERDDPNGSESAIWVRRVTS